jgi:ribosomal protein S18 acetylase RimI-like enzyme
MNWTIREATEKDLDRIVELLLQLYSIVSEKDTLQPESFRKNCRDLLSEKNSFFLVAMEGERLIGFLNFTVRRTCLHPGGSALVDELVVDREYREEGVGRDLIEEAVHRARALGCSEVEVSTEIENVRARSFYKKLGFEEIGVLLERAVDAPESPKTSIA